MRKVFLTVLASVFLSTFISLPALAITIDFQPQTQNVYLGNSFAVDLVISGLGDYTADSLSTFDINILFESTILDVDVTDNDSDSVIDSVVLDPSNQLDICGLGCNFLSAGISSPGTLNISDISFDSESDLNNFQHPSFTLATITFDAIGVGTSTLSLDSVILGDATGAPLTATLNTGSVNVAPVPEPATFLLMGVGLAGIVGIRRKLRTENTKHKGTASIR